MSNRTQARPACTHRHQCVEVAGLWRRQRCLDCGVPTAEPWLVLGPTMGDAQLASDTPK